MVNYSSLPTNKKNVIKMYTDRGFNIQTMCADSEFNCIRIKIHPIELDTVPKDKHVGGIKRSIRTIKTTFDHLFTPSLIDDIPNS